jgi:hypothetical protein
MTNLDKKDLLDLVSKNDQTALVLHWEGAACRPSRETAASILREIDERVAEGEDESFLWDIAYIMTEKEYKEEQSEYFQNAL